jgi:predicted lipoprotein with Yx(FWY)xxD motif
MSRHHALAGAGVLAATLLLSACGGSGYGSAAAPGPSTPRATTSSSGPTVRLGKTPVGTVLVDSHGKTLYAFAADSRGISRCTGSCLQYWPPDSPTTTAVNRSTGVTAKLTTIRRGDGTRQLTVNGWPVYTYAGDSGPGQAAGQGLDLSGGRWWVLDPTGAQVMSNSAEVRGDSDGY